MGGLDRAWLLFLLVALTLGLLFAVVAGLGLLRARHRRAGSRLEVAGSEDAEGGKARGAAASPDAWAEAGRRVQPYEAPRTDPDGGTDGPSC